MQSGNNEEVISLNKKLVWGIPAALILFGLLFFISARIQSPIPATVVDKGKVSYKPAVTSGRSRRDQSYTVSLVVTYSENNTAQVIFKTSNENGIPDIGDQVNITHGLSGMVVYPNRNLIALGRIGLCLGGLYLIIAFGVILALKWDKSKYRKSQKGTPP